MRAPLRCLLILCGALAAQPAAAEIVDLQVKRAGKKFEVKFEMLLDVPPERMLALFDEPQRWTGLSKVIRRVERLDEPGRRKGAPPPVSMAFYNCVLFLCMEAVKVSVFRIDPAAGIVTGTSLAGRGDFRYVRERWHVLPHARGTQVLFSAEIEPAFAVPPFIGPMVLGSMLKKLLREMEANLERMPDQ